jgi:glycosyltransferase involved in cell wall biosynthesis
MSQKFSLAFFLWSGKQFGGAERRFARLAAHLAENSNILVTLYCPAATLIPLKDIYLNSGALKIVPITSKVHQGLFGKLTSFLSVIKFVQSVAGLGHNHLFIAGNPSLLSFIITRMSRILPPISVAMVDVSYPYTATRIQRFFARNTLKKVYSVDCLSEGVRQGYLSELADKDKKKVSIAPCSFTEYSRTIESPVRDIDIVMIGRFVPGKGHELLRDISNQLADYNIHLCGSGCLDVRVSGSKIYEAKNPFEVLGRAKISLSLQKYGNYPSQVVLESMASGCAIIATDTGETRKMLDESCAVLIPYRAEDLLAAIKFLLSNPDHCRALGLAAKARVYEQHTVERYSEYFLSNVVGLNREHIGSISSLVS